MAHALIVEDNPEALQALEELVSDEGFSTSTAASLENARDAVRETWPDIVLLDLKLPDGKGLELLDELNDGLRPEVVLITGHATVDTAVEALREGVTDYLTKPVDMGRLQAVLNHVSRTRELREEIDSLRGELRRLGRFGRFVGASAPIQSVYDRIARVAPTDATVLITGESGTGKEVVARTIHDLSRRRNGPFRPLNCGAISANLLESELFGHEKGAFTGAERRHIGYIERASDGTLFLDEITEMPPESQVKLLRVLESGRITRVGGEEPVEVDTRVIAATNRRVEEAVERGMLREDLYYRLKVFQIYVPPLRDRGADVELLAQYFLDESNQKDGAQKRFAPEALRALEQYHWPGNVRELKNVVLRELKNVVRSAAILADEEIGVECLPSEVLRDDGMEPTGTAIRVSLGSSIAEAEKRLILATLEHCEDNKTRTAEVLGISPKTLYNRLKEYEHDDGGGERSADTEVGDNGGGTGSVTEGGDSKSGDSGGGDSEGA